MSNVLDVHAIEQSLEEERARLEESIASRLAEADEGRNPDRSDLAQSYTSRERDTALLGIEREQLKHVQDALQRLQNGSYGNCISCGDPIRPERLEALPYATLCIQCQAQRE